MNISEPELMVAAAQEVARLEERLSWHNRHGLPTNRLHEELHSARKFQADLTQKVYLGPHAPEGLQAVPCIVCSGVGHTYRRSIRAR